MKILSKIAATMMHIVKANADIIDTDRAVI